MATALNVTAQTDTRVLACCYDSALVCSKLKDITPLLTAADDEDVFRW